jgi:hypothetical protein
MIELIPSGLSSISVQSSGNAINTRNMFTKNKMQVIDLGFKNQGTNSLATITFDGGEITLSSGTKGEGAHWSPYVPSGFFDLGNYNVNFSAINPAAAVVHNLFVGYRFKIEKV